jgi:preprotein translocase subunit SecE
MFMSLKFKTLFLFSIRVDMNKLKLYYRQAKDELHKVIFPIKEQIRSAYFSVFVVVTVISLFLALIDAIMSVSLSSVIN